MNSCLTLSHDVEVFRKTLVGSNCSHKTSPVARISDCFGITAEMSLRQLNKTLYSLLHRTLVDRLVIMEFGSSLIP